MRCGGRVPSGPHAAHPLNTSTQLGLVHLVTSSLRGAARWKAYLIDQHHSASVGRPFSVARLFVHSPPRRCRSRRSTIKNWFRRRIEDPNTPRDHPKAHLYFLPLSPSSPARARPSTQPPARPPLAPAFPQPTTGMPLSKPQPEKAPVSTTSAHFIGPTKSILKPSPAQTPVQTPARVASPAPPEGAGARRAHFPPPGQEPTARYSGVDYDRSPIVVLPNVCALPERGCPGKTYFQDERGMRRRVLLLSRHSLIR